MAACCLDARNVPGLPGIPPIQHDKAWELCVKVINEVRGAEDAHNHYHTDDGTSDFMSTAAASLTTPLHLTSVEIARREKVNRTICAVLDPIRVLSEEGREIVDKIHRESFMNSGGPFDNL